MDFKDLFERNDYNNLIDFDTKFIIGIAGKKGTGKKVKETTKKEANIREAEQIKKSIRDISVEVYLDKGYGEYLISELGDYLKSKNINNIN